MYSMTTWGVNRELPYLAACVSTLPSVTLRGRVWMQSIRMPGDMWLGATIHACMIQSRCVIYFSIQMYMLPQAIRWCICIWPLYNMAANWWHSEHDFKSHLIPFHDLYVWKGTDLTGRVLPHNCWAWKIIRCDNFLMWRNLELPSWLPEVLGWCVTTGMWTSSSQVRAVLLLLHRKSQVGMSVRV